MNVVYTVPWHPDFAEMPGWLIHAIRAACLVIYEAGGLLPPLDELGGGIERHTGVKLDVPAVSVLCTVLRRIRVHCARRQRPWRERMTHADSKIPADYFKPPPDPEVAALEACLRVLVPLDAKARSRVLEYLDDRLAPTESQEETSRE